MTHFRVQGSGFRVQCSGCVIFEFRVLRFRVQSFLFLSLACFVSFVFAGIHV